ncbi:protein kinase [Pichia kluyveri]|uniref:Serine/threonine-protein kinase RIO1 n=1 Tax=Pichia kluyveri TaxID=36015 RepID=A0AAV5RA40_PICKL|nr:protein kinase [Pichia kluyveri]
MSSSDYSDDEGNGQTFNNSVHTSNAREKADILERYSDKINLDMFAKHRITRDKALRATVNQVLDPRTLRFLGKIFNNGTITKINGCVSTGKEANIYYSENEQSGKEFAVKIYKTSILVFKDRTRYVVGEHRFGEKQSKNPRQMVKNWAEKEFRNLKRLHSEPLINSPQPIELRENILVMEYLTIGKGEPSPKLRDHDFKDLNEIIHYYHEMLILMRLLFQKCRLVHADLSEYNTIVHQDKLYVFDVSQSVEPDHPMAMDFLRMDIKNVNDFFSRIKKINVYPEREIFKFIITPHDILFKDFEHDNKDAEETKEFLLDYLNTLSLKSSEDDEFNDEVFRSLHLVSSLHNIEERDFNKFSNGDIDTLVDLVGSVKINKYEVENAEEDEDHNEEDSDEEDDDDEDNSDDEFYSDDERKNKPNNLKRFQDKDEKKLHKQQVKEAARENRKSKMKKHVKKKLVKKGKK